MTLEVFPTRPRRQDQRGVPNVRDVDASDVDIGALRAENAELRKVVVELSKLVIRNVLRDERRT
jgi:uncharacterized lipoprotein YajG